MSAYDKGHSAGFKGEQSNTNPYRKGTINWQAWRRGWAKGYKSYGLLRKGK